jgi:nucleoside-diphosphate-sugar epimerase
MRIFLAGASGVIGQRLIPRLGKRPGMVLLLDGLAMIRLIA